MRLCLINQNSVNDHVDGLIPYRKITIVSPHVTQTVPNSCVKRRSDFVLEVNTKTKLTYDGLTYADFHDICDKYQVKLVRELSVNGIMPAAMGGNLYAFIARKMFFYKERNDGDKIMRNYAAYDETGRVQVTFFTKKMVSFIDGLLKKPRILAHTLSRKSVSASGKIKTIRCGLHSLQAPHQRKLCWPCPNKSNYTEIE